MKRRWVVILFGAVFVGCRSSQPATNPFLRTTVPPPGTGQAVVTPGEPYYPGAAAPAAPPGSLAPGTVAPVVPTAPMAAPPPVINAPPVIPPRDKFSPPGGSFQYNQSSNQRSKAIGPVDADEAPEQAVVEQTPKIRRSLPQALVKARQTPMDAVQQAVLWTGESDEVVTASYQDIDIPDVHESAERASPGAPPIKLRVDGSNQGVRGNVAQANSLKIVGEAEQFADSSSSEVRSAKPVMRVTLGNDASKASAFREVGQMGGDASESTLEIARGGNLSSDGDIPDAR